MFHLSMNSLKRFGSTFQRPRMRSLASFRSSKLQLAPNKEEDRSLEIGIDYTPKEYEGLYKEAKIKWRLIVPKKTKAKWGCKLKELTHHRDY